MTQFQLRRVNLDALIQSEDWQSAEEDDSYLERWAHLGANPKWFANVPHVFQALANPQGTHDFAQPHWGTRMQFAYW